MTVSITEVPKPGTNYLRREYEWKAVRTSTYDADGLPEDPKALIALINDEVASFAQAGFGVPIVQVVTDCEDQGYDIGYTSSAQLHFGAKRDATPEEIVAEQKRRAEVKRQAKASEIARAERYLAQLRAGR